MATFFNIISMTLGEVKINTNCIVKEVNILDEKTKIRVMELGVVPGVTICVKHKSISKKTLLVIFSNSCFTINQNVAKNIVVAHE